MARRLCGPILAWPVRVHPIDFELSSPSQIHAHGHTYLVFSYSLLLGQLSR
jgi:hypothetical protein